MPPIAFTPDFTEQASTLVQWTAFRNKLPNTECPAKLSDVVTFLAEFLLPIARACANGESFNQRWAPGGLWTAGSWFPASELGVEPAAGKRSRIVLEYGGGVLGVAVLDVCSVVTMRLAAHIQASCPLKRRQQRTVAGTSAPRGERASRRSSFSVLWRPGVPGTAKWRR